MRISFSGFYGYKNTGDDAFLEVCAWGSNNLWNIRKNTFLGSNLPVLQNDYDSLSKEKFKGHNRLLSFNEVLKSDYFISAGGSTFSDHKLSSLKNVAYLTSKTFNTKLKLGAIGVSIGPFKNIEAEKRTVKYLKKLSFLALRDNRSYEFAKSINLPYDPINAFDLAALLPEVYKNNRIKTSKKTNKYIGISVCNYESFSIDGDVTNEKRREEFYIDLINSLPDDPDIIFRFFYFNGNLIIGDKAPTDYIISKVKGRRVIEIVDYQNSVFEMWSSISDCDVMISTRLHASIFACYAEIPFFLVEYHQKCTDFLDNIGHHKDYRLGDAEKSFKEVSQEIMSLLYKENIKRPLYIEDTKKMAKLNFTKTILSNE